MSRASWQRETRVMRFEEAYDGWRSDRLTQQQAASLLGVCFFFTSGSFRRYINRYEEAGLDGLIDKRVSQVSQRAAPVDEVLTLEALYKEKYDSWTVQHFFDRYRDRHGGERSYNWVRKKLQSAGLVKKGTRRGAHRKKRERAAIPGMLVHQDGSTHDWIEGEKWDLIVTMDDATNEVYSGFFVDEEGTESSMRGVRETIEKRGLFSSFYSDRGAHYWRTPKEGGKVDKKNLTQFGRAMKHLGIDMIAAYSPQARGRSERLFGTVQGRLPKELALEGITDMEAANRYLETTFWPDFNQRFLVEPREAGDVFVPTRGVNITDILCIHEERTVGNDNCVKYKGKSLQIPKDRYRYHYVKAKVMVLTYSDQSHAIFHGPRLLAQYDQDGRLIEEEDKRAA